MVSSCIDANAPTIGLGMLTRTSIDWKSLEQELAVFRSHGSVMRSGTIDTPTLLLSGLLLFLLFFLFLYPGINIIYWNLHSKVFLLDRGRFCI